MLVTESRYYHFYSWLPMINKGCKPFLSKSWPRSFKKCEQLGRNSSHHVRRIGGAIGRFNLVVHKRQKQQLAPHLSVLQTDAARESGRLRRDTANDAFAAQGLMLEWDGLNA
jgi:hypothetical protein